jgi:hypothetical protein
MKCGNVLARKTSIVHWRRNPLYGVVFPFIYISSLLLLLADTWNYINAVYLVLFYLRTMLNATICSASEKALVPSAAVNKRHEQSAAKWKACTLAANIVHGQRPTFRVATNCYLRFWIEVHLHKKVMHLKISVFGIVIPCRLVKIYRRFGQTSCLKTDERDLFSKYL